MTLHHPTHARWLAAALAIIGWSALAIEFHFIIDSERPHRIGHAAVVFLSFFTIISNLLAAIVGYWGIVLSVALLSLMFLVFGWIVVAINRAAQR